MLPTRVIVMCRALSFLLLLSAAPALAFPPHRRGLRAPMSGRSPSPATPRAAAAATAEGAGGEGEGEGAPHCEHVLFVECG